MSKRSGSFSTGGPDAKRRRTGDSALVVEIRGYISEVGLQIAITKEALDNARNLVHDIPEALVVRADALQARVNAVSMMPRQDKRIVAPVPPQDRQALYDEYTAVATELEIRSANRIRAQQAVLTHELALLMLEKNLGGLRMDLLRVKFDRSDA